MTLWAFLTSSRPRANSSPESEDPAEVPPPRPVAGPPPRDVARLVRETRKAVTGVLESLAEDGLLKAGVDPKAPFARFGDVVNLDEVFDFMSNEAFETVAPVLGVGMSRVAYDLGDGVAIKVSLCAFGASDNLAEASTWGTASVRVARLLMPVQAVAPDGAWLTMPVATWLPFMRQGATWKAARKVLPKALTWDADRSRNWGMWRGTPRLLDYAPSRAAP